MTKAQMLDDLLSKGNGYLTSDAANKAGVSNRYFSDYVQERGLLRAAHGIYYSQDTWKDNLYILSLRWPKAILSNDTSLELHGLTERESDVTHVTVPLHYNATALRNEGIAVHASVHYDLGISEAKTFYGNTVRVYDPERTICDIVKARKKTDLQVFQYALREYTKRPGKRLGKLMDYAMEMRIDAEMRKYMEVLI